MERGVFGQDENARGGERDGMREDDAGFAALDATEPFFGSSPAQNFGGAVSGTDGFSGFESADGGIAAHGGFEPLTFEAPTAPAELGAFEALAFEAPAPLAEPVLDWGPRSPHPRSLARPPCRARHLKCPYRKNPRPKNPGNKNR